MLVDAVEVYGALERNEVVPAFQPIVDLRDGSLLGLEVLARWQHAELGPILPQNFITVAEQNGLIGRLSRQVMTQSFQFASTLPTPLVLGSIFRHISCTIPICPMRCWPLPRNPALSWSIFRSRLQRAHWWSTWSWRGTMC
jgi:EAL domain-containing protein (putative c-di-GMP-specific phosphodiesterase class I)